MGTISHHRLFVNRPITFIAFCIAAGIALAENPQTIPVADGWARTSVNAVIFRNSSVTTYGDTQYVAFYDPDQTVVLAKQKLDSKTWEIRKTSFKGNCKDAHNSISIGVDGDGFLHMSWDQHAQSLRYCRSVASGSLELTGELSMTGTNEQSVTYPEFHRLPDGNLLFAFRDGRSGRGNLVMNLYNTKTRHWRQLQSELISGEGKRNPYWQMAVDSRGTIHLSWVWRETPDVGSNHDLCYAKSADGGRTWVKSSGEAYRLPITAATAEYAAHIPQRSELINQTSMCTDAAGHPYIATYWRPEGQTVPQFFVIYDDGTSWKTSQVTKRTTPFTLSGVGTKAIPISRPQICASVKDGKSTVYVIFRDQERQNRVSVAACDGVSRGEWKLRDLTTESVGMWEPTYDTDLWTRTGTLHLFVQRVGQGDAETAENVPPQPVSILEWKPE